MVKWPFQGLSDLQLVDQKVTLNHLANNLSKNPDFLDPTHFIEEIGRGTPPQKKQFKNTWGIFRKFAHFRNIVFGNQNPKIIWEDFSTSKLQHGNP